jgi:hypothetical protein
VVRRLERRLQRLENLERLVEEGVEEELEAAFDRLEWHLTRDELHRGGYSRAKRSPDVGLNRRLKRLEEVSKREQANPFGVGVRQPRGPQGVCATASPFAPTTSRLRAERSGNYPFATCLPGK